MVAAVRRHHHNQYHLCNHQFVAAVLALPSSTKWQIRLKHLPHNNSPVAHSCFCYDIRWCDGCHITVSHFNCNIRRAEPKKKTHRENPWAHHPSDHSFIVSFQNWRQSTPTADRVLHDGDGRDGWMETGVWVERLIFYLFAKRSGLSATESAWLWWWWRWWWW